MDRLKRISHKLFGTAGKAEDGRDAWPNRLSYILATMGGTIGMGNVLRFPSVAFNNYGLQFFIPYIMALLVIAIPGLILEVAIGNAYRGGSVVAYNCMNKRLRGTGLSLLFVTFLVLSYFNIIMSWIMVYFRHSFSNPLPWHDRDPEDFFMQDVLQVVDPIEGGAFNVYPSIGFVGELVGWCAFTWFLVYICIFRGVGWTGRVVYFTMGLPIIMGIILTGRGVSLPNAREGIKLYFATWRGSALSGPAIWQAACGQVFFSTGVGFGYYTAYASYNRKFANAVQDAIIVVSANVAFEVFVAFGVFGIVGFLGLHPSTTVAGGSFDIGFVTFPAALTQMPAANFWSAIWFLTLFILGTSSAFAMLDSIVTLIMDAHPHFKRELVVLVQVVVGMLVSLPYCTHFGYHLLNNIDAWVNNIALVFVVFAECFAATTVYRWKDVVSQVGLPSFIWFNSLYLAAMIFGVMVGHLAHPGIGAGVGFALFAIGCVVALFKAQTPTAQAPKFWQKDVWLHKTWFLAFYSGNQLQRDLNLIVATGRNWKIPAFWAPLLKYITSPILVLVTSLAYPDFITDGSRDPLHIVGFFLAHATFALVVLSFVMPRWFNAIVLPERRLEGDAPTVVNLESNIVDALADHSLEGQESNSSINGSEEDKARDMNGSEEDKAKVGPI
ncbi:Nn.00g024330.m01.CDS01 [Neocucurbitaria sp. VM-36]